MLNQTRSQPVGSSPPENFRPEENFKITIAFNTYQHFSSQK